MDEYRTIQKIQKVLQDAIQDLSTIYNNDSVNPSQQSPDAQAYLRNALDLLDDASGSLTAIVESDFIEARKAS